MFVVALLSSRLWRSHAFAHRAIFLAVYSSVGAGIFLVAFSGSLSSHLLLRGIGLFAFLGAFSAFGIVRTGKRLVGA